MSEFNPRTPPTWAEHLVIYELNPRAFTSPNGAGGGDGSGTFASLAEKLPYLAELGVNGIWMAGHHLATSHFYGIWTVYAALEPDQIDPSLGSPDELKAMVATAHEHGIRIFLDVIAHGVLHESSLVTRHPDWFTSSSWGMADYDYTNPEFRAWWTEMWVKYAIDFDIDGFRIDVAMGDIRLWDDIVERVAELGKEIVVFPENERYHFSQQDIMGTEPNPVRALHIKDFLGEPRGLTSQQISCHDYGWESLPGNHFFLKGSRAHAAHGALLGPHIPVFMSGEEFDADPVPLPHLTQGLYGTGGPGGWLYGNRLDWEQVAIPEKAAMLEDVTLMLRLRREYPQLLNADTSTTTVALVPHDGKTALVPYAVSRENEALIVLANDSDNAVTTGIRVPRAALGFDAESTLTVVDTVTGEEYLPDSDVYSVTIGADRTPGGGFALLHVTAR